MKCPRACRSRSTKEARCFVPGVLVADKHALAMLWESEASRAGATSSIPFEYRALRGRGLEDRVSSAAFRLSGDD